MCSKYCAVGLSKIEGPTVFTLSTNCRVVWEGDGEEYFQLLPGGELITTYTAEENSTLFRGSMRSLFPTEEWTAEDRLLQEVLNYLEEFDSFYTRRVAEGENLIHPEEHLRVEFAGYVVIITDGFRVLWSQENPHRWVGNYALRGTPSLQEMIDIL